MEEMNISEIFAEKCEENQTRKILEIMRESKDLAEAIEKVKDLLNKQQKCKSPESCAYPHGSYGASIEGKPFNKIIITQFLKM